MLRLLTAGPRWAGSPEGRRAPSSGRRPAWRSLSVPRLWRLSAPRAPCLLLPCTDSFPAAAPPVPSTSWLVTKHPRGVKAGAPHGGERSRTLFSPGSEVLVRGKPRLRAARASRGPAPRGVWWACPCPPRRGCPSSAQPEGAARTKHVPHAVCSLVMSAARIVVPGHRGPTLVPGGSIHLLGFTLGEGGDSLLFA